SRKENALLAGSSTNFTQPSPRRAPRNCLVGPVSARTSCSVVDGVEAPASAIAGEPAERAVVELHVPLVLNEGRFRPPLARHAPRPCARDDPPREPGGAEMDGRSGGDLHLYGSRRSHSP